VINVAVLDTGIDLEHPDLQPFVAGGFSSLGGNYADLNGHGTHVAGTIAAANNDFGVVGVAPGVRLWSVRVLSGNGSGSSESVLSGLEWVIEKKREIGGRWIANLSLGDEASSPAEHQAFRNAVNEGIIVIAASGNYSTAEAVSPVAYPAAYPEVVAVGATDLSGVIATFSCQGPELDVTAPGVSILSTVPRGGGFLSFVTDGDSIFDAYALTGSSSGKINGEFVYCGLGKPGDFPPAVSGRIALIQRGEIRFAEKAKAAKEAGAIAVIIFNNVEGSLVGWTLIPDDDPSAQTYEWPLTMALSKQDGEYLAQAGSGSVTVTNVSDDYGYMNGTSMATPHVAGAAALIWSIAPEASPSEVVAALVQTAVDHGPAGFDQTFGHGVIDVYAAAERLAPTAFLRSGRPFLRRGR
jgi:subtilisin family serine protease